LRAWVRISARGTKDIARLLAASDIVMFSATVSVGHSANSW
jgi:hypothetical protein